MSSITPGRQPSGQPSGRPTLDPTSPPSHLPSPTAWTNPRSFVRQLEKFECGSDAAEKRAFEMKCQKYFNFSHPSRPEPLEFVFRLACFYHNTTNSNGGFNTTRQLCLPLHIIIMMIIIGQLKTFFSQGDSLFITIFASLFSVLGILLNLLVLVAVLNYRVTRRHVSSSQ